MEPHPNRVGSRKESVLGEHGSSGAPSGTRTPNPLIKRVLI
jgi:hypothetical protein